MRDRSGSDATPDGRPIDPVAMARRDLKKALPRRFWQHATVVARGAGYGVDLDGKPLRTPAKAELLVPWEKLAEAIASEWRGQGETVEPDTMPLTRIVNSALDGVAQAMEATVAEVAKYADTDLVCYRADKPEKLVDAQAAAWDPILSFAREDLGARFICVQGVVYVEQPRPARDAVRDAVAELAALPGGALRLAALSVMTSLTGSVLIALALARQGITAEAAWVAAHVDEDHQQSIWGSDREASARRDLRWRDMTAAALILDCGRTADVFPGH